VTNLSDELLFVDELFVVCCLLVSCHLKSVIKRMSFSSFLSGRWWLALSESGSVDPVPRFKRLYNDI